MGKVICVIMTLGGLLCGARADGLAPSLIRTSGQPALETGCFYGYRAFNDGPGDSSFAACLDFVRANHVPLVLVWGNAGCTHCEGFAQQLNGDAELPAWMGRTRALFAYFKGTGGTAHPLSEHAPAACKAAYDFTVSCGAPVGRRPWPFYAIYYPKADGTSVAVAGSLAENYLDGEYASCTAAEFRKMVDDFLDENEEDPVPGLAAFLNADLAEARLEAMPSTKAVLVPLVCSVELDGPVTNRLSIVYPDGAHAESNVVWQAGAGRRVQEVCVPVAGRGASGQSVRLSLRSELGVLNGISAIHYVDETANCQRFPYFYGEKSAAELAWGEWTMDLDVATNRVAAAAAKGERAYTLLAVGGALWCPNCTNIEHYVYNDPKFAGWAQEHHVALVTYDQPMNGLTAPTLLTHDVYAKTGRSGSSYLSRKGLSVAEGQTQFDRVSALSHMRWPEGFLVEPTAGRIANPVLILLRPDGTPAGRFTSQRVRTGGSTGDEPYDVDENLARLTELLALADDTSARGLTEEVNNKPGTTPLTHRFGTTDEFSLQVNDRADVFRLEDMPVGKPVRFDVTAGDGAKDAVSVNVLLATNGTGSAMLCRPLASVAEGVWKFTEEDLSEGVFVELSSYADARYPQYGGGTAFSGSFTTREVPPDPGVVGFAAEDVEVVEGTVREVRLEVLRTRGASGPVSVRIDRIDDPALTTADPARYVWEPSDGAAHTLTWAETELGSRWLPLPIVDDTISDGLQTVAFELKVVDGAGVMCGIVTNFVHLVEDDSPSVGRLAITDTDPAGLDRRNVQAVEGSTLAFEVSRLGGSSGRVGASLVTSSAHAVLSTNRLVWTDCNRNVGRRAEQIVTVRVPRRADLGRSGCFTVTLVPDDGVPHDVAALSFAVWVLAADEAFAYERPEEISVVQREGVSLTFEPVRAPSGDVAYSLETVSGTLPDGVTASVDSETGVVTVSGVVKEETPSEGVLQVKGVDAAGNVVRGLPIRLTFSVTALSDAVPAFAESRSFTGVPLFAEAARTVSGTVDVSLPKSGRASVRYRSIGGVATSFAIDAWSFDRQRGVFTGEGERGGIRVRVEVLQDGGASVDVRDPQVDAGVLRATLPVAAEAWGEGNPATRWQGVYTVACPVLSTNGQLSCSGVPVLSVRLDTETAKFTGVAKYAGVLPSGRTFSGSMPLVRVGGEEFARVTAFAYASREVFGAVLRVLPDGAEQAGISRQRVFADEGTQAFWQTRTGTAFCQAYGSWFDPDENWEARWMGDYLSSRQPVAAGGEVIGWLAAHTVDIAVDDAVPNANGLTFALNRSTGVCSGVFEASGVRYRWRGVLLPGWAEGCGDCGTEGGETGVVLPFGLGSCWTEASPHAGCEVKIGE